ncbi:MAG: triacylglycerol lipase [Clostridiaceae bacterium]|nr:triacylglycerol lipase [Clostridiaceae bacterium]
MDNVRRILFRFRNILVFILLMNLFLIKEVSEINSVFFVLGTICFVSFYLLINIKPLKTEKLNKRLNIMMGGYELIVDFTFCLILEIGIYIYYNINNIFSLTSLLINGLIGIIVLGIALFNGVCRIMVTSRNLGIKNRLMILLLCWFPIFNIMILRSSCKKVKFEYMYEKTKEERNEVRKESEVCKTKYPLVLVHGIFFRDWMFINYWGRIPKELVKHGAEVYYGKQGSSNAVAISGQELKNNILKIIEETGCEKVNIIAHSKGGLDARYAISKLGLEDYVASLTTINTPHRGCKYVDFLLDKFPKSLKMFIDKHYNSIFKKLGDENPEFLKGVEDLTASKCKEFNMQVKNSDKVLYQSVASKMDNVFSAGFPLNLGYMFAKHFDGENDGLVAVPSAVWGDYLGTITAKSRGISHGDVIDMTRQDIKEYDVCEFYVEIVKNLKERGL